MKEHKIVFKEKFIEKVRIEEIQGK